MPTPVTGIHSKVSNIDLETGINLQLRQLHRPSVMSAQVLSSSTPSLHPRGTGFPHEDPGAAAPSNGIYGRTPYPTRATVGVAQFGAILFTRVCLD